MHEFDKENANLSDTLTLKILLQIWQLHHNLQFSWKYIHQNI